MSAAQLLLRRLLEQAGGPSETGYMLVIDGEGLENLPDQISTPESSYGVHRVGSELAPDLSEVGIARHAQCVVEADMTVWIAIERVITDRTARPGQTRADASVGQAHAHVARRRQRGS